MERHRVDFAHQLEAFGSQSHREAVAQDVHEPPADLLVVSEHTPEPNALVDVQGLQELALVLPLAIGADPQSDALLIVLGLLEYRSLCHQSFNLRLCLVVLFPLVAMVNLGICQ